MIKEKEVLEFSCPKCGSHFFGSSRNDDGTYTRGCGNCDVGCHFSWPEQDDWKHFSLVARTRLENLREYEEAFAASSREEEDE